MNETIALVCALPLEQMGSLDFRQQTMYSALLLRLLLFRGRGFGFFGFSLISVCLASIYLAGLFPSFPGKSCSLAGL